MAGKDDFERVRCGNELLSDLSYLFNRPSPGSTPCTGNQTDRCEYTAAAEFHLKIVEPMFYIYSIHPTR